MPTLSTWLEAAGGFRVLARVSAKCQLGMVIVAPRSANSSARGRARSMLVRGWKVSLGSERTSNNVVNLLREKRGTTSPV